MKSAKSGAQFHEDKDTHQDEHEDEHRHGDEHAPVPLRDQIEDLVDWVAEIAADTNLSEADWIPLHEKSESVSANLKANRGDLTEEQLRELESLCQLIDDTIPKIPEQLPDLRTPTS
ncbi:hypothetical protein [Novipirellula artificiosorum]|nr:hypothetical protein [Novipirellula artificiosorum]